MKNLKIIFILLTLLVSTSACANQDKDYKVTINKTDKDSYKIHVVGSSGNEIRSITYKNLKLANKWILQFNNGSGAETINKSGEPSLNIYEEAFYAILQFLEENEYERINKVVYDLSADPSTFNFVVGKIKESLKNKDGKVINKDKQLTKIMRSSLLDGILVERTCEIASRLEYQCLKNKVGTLPIAFQRSYLGKNWDELISQAEVGLHPSLTFTVNLE
ncbi:hypothetical protein [Kangiella sp. TOML190]|uniref:hypothetical protein n=1 Tax=Kangiella sp. TOML190 TaxID=2931351 RepID=UPI00203E5359|nr:hypothetical protein [Kangiella sp. TOML190]